MDKLGHARTSEREVFYLSTTTENWYDLLPMENWLVLPIVEKKDVELWSNVAKACLDNQVTYVCTIGNECEQLHDWFDETILVRRFQINQSIGSPDDFENEPMTTWHKDFEEGFWFSITSAYDGNKEISSVVCLDLTENGNKSKLSSLLSAINNGWLPDD